MSQKIPVSFQVYCPGCGGSVVCSAVFLQHVEAPVPAAPSLYRPNGHISIHIGSVINVEHDCIERVPTDGLQPIERFIKHGELSDSGVPK